MPSLALPTPAHLIGDRIVGHVRALFHDGRRGEQPVQRSNDALFAPDSVIWRVHGDVTTMLVGGISALLLQMLHPAALTGVLQHSAFRDDMIGRLRRTARFIAVTTYGERTAAEAAIARVRAIHARVTGTLADGTPYRADDPRLLAWVHVAEAISFLDAWIAFGDPLMSRADQDRYFAESAVVARALGADPVPQTRAEALALLAGMRPALHASVDCKQVAQLILTQRPAGPSAAMAQTMVARSAVDLLPDWARRELGLRAHGLSTPAVRAATFGMAATLRWAFATAR